MPIITDSITYNVKNRGRKARGQERHFDTVALARLINSPSVQEKVKHGDMVGYFGHWPRIKLGMEPKEGGIVDGKVVSIPPAIRTVELSADDDGNITHRTEFLDTNEGRIAARLFQSKAGGFSSAITGGLNGSVPTGFYGFDYVMEPNFTFNRGYSVALDSVGEDAGRADVLEMLDSVVGEAAQASGHILALFDSLQDQHNRLLEAFERSVNENVLLIEQMASKPSGGNVLDSAAILEDVRVGPLLGEHGDPDEFKRFRDIPLSKLSQLDSVKEPEDPTVRHARSFFGVAR